MILTGRHPGTLMGAPDTQQRLSVWNEQAQGDTYGQEGGISVLLITEVRALSQSGGPTSLPAPHSRKTLSNCRQGTNKNWKVNLWLSSFPWMHLTWQRRLAHFENLLREIYMLGLMYGIHIAMQVVQNQHSSACRFTAGMRVKSLDRLPSTVDHHFHWQLKWLQSPIFVTQMSDIVVVHFPVK